MNNNKRRRRGKRRPRRMSFAAVLTLLLLMLLIPIIALWLGARHVDRVVPDYATGHIVETTPTAAPSD